MKKGKQLYITSQKIKRTHTSAYLAHLAKGKFNWGFTLMLHGWGDDIQVTDSTMLLYESFTGYWSAYQQAICAL